MKIAYLDCQSGISGDMVLGALVDAGVDLAQVQAGIDSLGLAGCRLDAQQVKRGGFRATKVSVRHSAEPVHRSLGEIAEMIDRSALPVEQKNRAKTIFTRLGQAEAKVHGIALEQVHFHEIGAVDSIADVVGSAIGWDLLGADRIICSPIPVGRGTVQIAHGRVSIPAPATAELLRGIPLAASTVEAELTTPTGAAIVATLVDQFGALPAMKIDSIGYGAGDRELDEQANLLRLIVGGAADRTTSDQVWLLETNLDDVSGEIIGHCADLLLQSGALDVYATAIQMKKNRPGVKLSVLCQPADLGKLEGILFRETTTLGVRRWLVSRHKLQRRPHTVETPWGPVVGKVAIGPEGRATFTPEYDSCRKIAEEKHIPLKDVYEVARKAFGP